MEAEITNLVDNSKNKKDGKLICKFILVGNGEIINLVFGLYEDFRYHANLVNNFCNKNEIASGWVKKPDIYEIYEDGCEIKGGGWIEMDITGKKMKFFGESKAYGQYKRSDLNFILNHHSYFSGYNIIVS